MRLFRFALRVALLGAPVWASMSLGDPAAAQQPAAPVPLCSCPGSPPVLGACRPNPQCPPVYTGQGAPAPNYHHGYSASRPTLVPAAPASSALPPPSPPLPSVAVTRPVRPTLAPIGNAASSVIQDASSEIVRPLGGGGPRVAIQATGYDLLDGVGTEAPGYGLYSYAILPQQHTDKAAALLDVLFNTIAPIGETGGSPAQQNVLYVPVHKGKGAEWMVFRQDDAQKARLGEAFLSSFYDFKIAQDILAHICSLPRDSSVVDLCMDNPFSKGPYLFAYAQPASATTPVAPPFLLVDLTRIDPAAFREVVDAFQAQVQRNDISDRAKINTLRLKLLNLVMLGSSMLPSIKHGVGASLPGGNEK